MKKVNLLNFYGVGFIFPERTGIEYSTQAAGTSVLLKSLEGVFVPFTNDYHPREYKNSDSYQLGELFERYSYFGDYINEQIANDLNDFFNERRLYNGIQVDKGRLGSSCEAWIYVTIDHNENKFINNVVAGFETSEAVLTWFNRTHKGTEL